ncbi:MAG TPA: response regulator [Geobacteraceae bacterium]
MQIVCPGCKARFSFDVEKIDAAGIKLRCSKCKTIFRVVRKDPAPASAPFPGAAPTGLPRTKVVVANESPAFCKAVAGVLATEPFDVFSYHDGREAFDAVLKLKPDCVLLDVALPSMYGFEVCDAIRKEPSVAGTKVILIASIYDKTRYKRAPLSLYGADDYIEKHHIPDSLAVMIYRLLSGQKPAEAPPDSRREPEEEAQAKPEELSRSEAAAQEITRQELKKDEESGTYPAAAATEELSEAHEKARRLARLIVSDIVLYSQEKVERGVKEGIFFELLADDVKEGRALYESRVPEEIRNCSSYLEEGFAELIATKTKEPGL